MNRRTFTAGALAGIAALPASRLAAAAVISDGQSSPTRLRWSDLGSDWTDGVPLANGQLGAMAWARGGRAVVSLDRLDAWDERDVPEFEEAGFTYANLLALRAAKNTAEIARQFEKPFHLPGRGKLPLGRIQLGFAAGDVASSTLDMGAGTGGIALKDGTMLTLLVAAEAPMGLIRVRGPSAAAIAAAARVEAPPFGAAPSGKPGTSPLDYGGAEHLGYGAPRDLGRPGLSGYLSGAGAARVAVLARTLAAGDDMVIAWTATRAETDEAAEAAARATLEALTPARIDRAMAAHAAWWGRFWKPVAVETGDPALNTRWALSTYHLGAAAREGGPPVPLQSPWTWDNGRLPAWKGDYHHDLNTQMTYWPAYAGNRPGISRNLIDWLWATKPEAERFARSFYGAPGLALPGTTDLRNRALGGWAAYSFSPTATAWLLHHFALHWRHFGDAAFLRERAYPYAEGVTTFLAAMLKPRPGRGGLFLPAFISPEINDNRLNSWFDEWTNFDLALVRYAFTTAAAMADGLGRRADAARHRAVLARLPDFARDPDGGFSLAAGVPLEASHRHFSHLIAFHPLRLLDPLSDAQAVRALNASLARLDRLGTKMWMGYSFAWLAALHAAAGRGADAANALAVFEEGFTGRNGFHTNGDRSGRAITAFPGRLFTLEGGSAALAATQDMMLLATPAAVRLFPAMPPGATAAFTGLNADGIIVSARLAAGRLASATLLSGVARTVSVSAPGLPARTFALPAGKPVSL